MEVVKGQGLGVVRRPVDQKMSDMTRPEHQEAGDIKDREPCMMGGRGGERGAERDKS